MPKAYWIAHVTVTDPDPYALYAKGATEAFEKHGARVLARGGEVVALEGQSRRRETTGSARARRRSCCWRVSDAVMRPDRDACG